LRQFKKLSEGLMPSLCTIQHQILAREPGAVSRITYTPDPALTDLPCRLSIVGLPNQLVTADQLRTAARWNVTLPLGTTVLEKDRLVVTGEDIDGNPYLVTLDVAGIETPKSYAIHVKVSGTLVIPNNG
jgi:hypothetical protein